MKWLRTEDVAQAFGVDPNTVRVWARKGQLRSRRTLGGHRRYVEADVKRMLREWSMD
jgi:excisionase family DNA binding protein